MVIPENVSTVVEDGLCVGCGTCVAACPTDAILMKVSRGLFLPIVEKDKCTSCSLCYKVCPGHSVDFSRLKTKAFSKQTDDFFLGSFIRCYSAHSNSHDIRFGCTSGGVITQLLIFALEKNIIDGVLVARMKEDKPPSFIFAYGKEKPIFKLWVPECDGLQLLGFARNPDFDSVDSGLEREPAEPLSDPVESGRVDTLRVEPSYAKGNDLFLNFTYNYTSSKTESGEDDTIPKEVKLPISDIPSSTKTFPFGVGTYVGNCIKIVSYEICQ